MIPAHQEKRREFSTIMTGFFSKLIRRPAKGMALLLTAALLAASLGACGLSNEQSSTSSTGTSDSSAQSPSEEVSATEDPSLKGEGTVSLLGVLGNRESGFAFQGAAWFSGKEEFQQNLAAQWPDVAGELTAEYENSGNGVYLTAGMGQFSDYPYSACFRITETNSQVTACSYVFSFGEQKEEYISAFLQAREMMTESFGGADEEVPAFDAELPSGATWYGDDGSGLGITDTSPDQSNYQFEIVLSAPQVQG